MLFIFDFILHMVVSEIVKFAIYLYYGEILLSTKISAVSFANIYINSMDANIFIYINTRK